MRRFWRRRALMGRFLTWGLVVSLLLSLSACLPDDRGLTEAHIKYERQLMLDKHYISPVQAEWASVFLAPQLPPRSQAESEFQAAWFAGIEYMHNSMIEINQQGHLFYADLLNTADELISSHGELTEPVIQSIIDYTEVLLQSDISIRVIQSGQLQSGFEQAVMEYNLLLVSAKLASQSTQTVNDLFSWVLADDRNMSEEEYLEFEKQFSHVLSSQLPILKNSRRLIEMHARIQVADKVVGDLLEGAVLAKIDGLLEQTDIMFREKELDQETADGIELQLLELKNSLIRQPGGDVYQERAKGFLQLVNVALDIALAPVDYLSEVIKIVVEPVAEPVREEINLLSQTVDEHSGYRFSTASDLVEAQIRAFAETLGLSEEQAAAAVQAVALATLESGLSPAGLANTPQISSDLMAELDYLDREDERVPNILEANGFHLLAQLTGYIQTLADDSLSWLDSAMTEAVDFVSLPPAEETDHLEDDIVQLSALLFSEGRSESEIQYLADLLGVDLDAWEQEYHQTSLAWLQEIKSLADQFIEFIGPDTVQTMSGLNDLFMLPINLFDYPLNRFDATLAGISRYAQVQGNRMSLSMLESIHDLYLELGLREGVNLDGLNEELEQAISGYLDLESALNHAADLTDRQAQLTFTELLTQLTSGSNPQISQALIDRLQVLLDIYQAGEDTPESSISDNETSETTPESETSEVRDSEPLETTSETVSETADTSVRPTDDPADLWLGYWAGTMRIRQFDMPDQYSEDEQEAMLNADLPIDFTISMSDDMGYMITDMQGREHMLGIDHRQMTIIFTESTPDGSVVIYQVFVGDLSPDSDQISGNFTTGAEEVGDFYSGTWSVTRQQ